jgi:hypothetical protein
MKIKFIEYLCASVILFGCATPFNIPLKIDTDGPRLAQIIGVNFEDVRFISYCRFDELRAGKYYVKLQNGTCVLTEERIYLLVGNFRSASTFEGLSFAIEELEGVDTQSHKSLFSRKTQIQIVQGQHIGHTRIIVLEITANRAVIAQEESSRFYDLLIASGVPEWESKRYYHSDPPPSCFTYVPIPVPMASDPVYVPDIPIVICPP